MTTQKARLTFKYRTRMLNFGENFRGSEETKLCPLCNEHKDDQNEIEHCKQMKDKYKNLERCKVIYSDSTNQEAIELLSCVVDYRNEILEKQIK